VSKGVSIPRRSGGEPGINLRNTQAASPALQPGNTDDEAVGESDVCFINAENQRAKIKKRGEKNPAEAG